MKVYLINIKIYLSSEQQTVSKFKCNYINIDFILSLEIRFKKDCVLVYLIKMCLSRNRNFIDI